MRPLWAIKKISLESPRLAWFNGSESQKFELECKTSRIYLAFYFILFALIHNFRTFQATLGHKNDITRKLWINSILWCTNKKNLSWNARPFGPLLCFQIQIGDRDCIPTPGMQIQIGRFSSNCGKNYWWTWILDSFKKVSIC